MKKSQSIITITVLLAGLAFWVAANAETTQSPTNPGSGYSGMHAKRGPAMLRHLVKQNMAAQALSDITKVPVDTLSQKLQQERLPQVLREYQVDWKTFGAAMHARFQDLLSALVAGNFLTPDQMNQIVARMDQNFQRRALMRSLVDKAVQDGTISADQAQLLGKKP